MKKRLAMVLALGLSLTVLFAGCGNSQKADNGGANAGAGDTEKQTGSAQGAGVDKVYYTYTDMAERQGIQVGQGTTLTIFKDGTYMLATQQTMDINEASGGYLQYVGNYKVAFGTFTYADSEYELDHPTRVIFSDYMMTGPGSVTEIYVDTDDTDSYANYSLGDITTKSAEEVIDLLLASNYVGEVDDSYEFTKAVAVNESTFMIEELY